MGMSIFTGIPIFDIGMSNFHCNKETNSVLNWNCGDKYCFYRQTGVYYNKNETGDYYNCYDDWTCCR